MNNLTVARLVREQADNLYDLLNGTTRPTESELLTVTVELYRISVDVELDRA